MERNRVILGVDPGLAHTGWGVVAQSGNRLSCQAYGCIETPASASLHERLGRINVQACAIVGRYQPTCVGIETVWFGANARSAFATGQARGAFLAALSGKGISLGEFAPSQIKLAVVGVGAADKSQVQYMVQQLLSLEAVPSPDHAADALAAAICFATHDFAGKGIGL